MKTTSSATTPTREEISQRARAIWEQAGRPADRDQEYWLQAERELREAIQQAPGVGSKNSGSGVPFSIGKEKVPKVGELGRETRGSPDSR